MREIRRTGNYPCQTISHILKFQDVIDNNIVIKGIAVVKSTVNTPVVIVLAIAKYI